MVWVSAESEDLDIYKCDNKYVKINEDLFDKKQAIELAEHILNQGMEILCIAKKLKE